MKLRYEKSRSSVVFKEPIRKIQEVKQLENFIFAKKEKEKAKYSHLVAKLDAYSPLKTLTRGYSITQKEGKLITKQIQLQSGDEVELRFVDGCRQAKIQ